MDWPAIITAVLGGLTGVIGAIALLILPIMKFLREEREERRLRAVGAEAANKQRGELAKAVVAVAEKVEAVAIKTEETHGLVNGTSDELKAAREDIGFLRGKAAEKANPTPIVAVPEVTHTAGSKPDG